MTVSAVKTLGTLELQTMHSTCNPYLRLAYLLYSLQAASAKSWRPDLCMWQQTRRC